MFCVHIKELLRNDIKFTVSYTAVLGRWHPRVRFRNEDE